MARIKLTLPANFPFNTFLDIRITDINYGNHLGNDAYLALMHEAREQYLRHLGFSEMDIGGTAIIMADTAIVYKSECHYGDRLMAEVVATEFRGRSFELFYRFTRMNDKQLVCEAKTGMVCFDYNLKSTTPVPQVFQNAVSNDSGSIIK
jgi:YbgC/YbaW family acyl-CoA thioester hydrolase